MQSQHLSIRVAFGFIVSPGRMAPFALASLLLAGCGQTGAPLPPSLELPEVVADLAATRVANRVELKWTMPRRTTDKLLLKGPQPVRICRRIADGPCVEVADLTFAPEKPVVYEDALPVDLAAGAPRLLAYSVDVLNRRGRSAGASNFAYTGAGLAPPPFIDARAQVQSDGVLLQWQPAALSGDANGVSIQRTLLSIPARQENRSKSPLGNSSEHLVKLQALTVHMPPGADPGKALDPDAEFDQRYRYTIARVETLTIGGKSIEIQGPPSPEIFVETKDAFPPAAPVGLAAVAAPREGAIDLSWVPNNEKDLAGYAVYRREAAAQPIQLPVRISDAAERLDSPAFRDSTALPGREYAYFVTAIDRDGNESKPSSEAIETLAPKP
jgi:hypothetical protein